MTSLSRGAASVLTGFEVMLCHVINTCFKGSNK